MLHKQLLHNLSAPYEQSILQNTP